MAKILPNFGEQQLVMVNYACGFNQSDNLVPRSLVDEAEGEIWQSEKFVFLDWLLHLTPVQSPL